MTGHRSALPPRYFITLHHQPTTRAILVLCYYITLAWRGGQCGLCPQHGAMICGQCGQCVCKCQANVTHARVWAMWAICFELPT